MSSILHTIGTAISDFFGGPEIQSIRYTLGESQCKQDEKTVNNYVNNIQPITGTEGVDVYHIKGVYYLNGSCHAQCKAKGCNCRHNDPECYLQCSWTPSQIKKKGQTLTVNAMDWGWC